jgi:hypothetical protein
MLMVECGCGLSACLETPLEASPKDDATSPTLAPPALRRPRFNRPEQQQGSITIQGTEEGIKAIKERHKQCHQEATTDDDGGINEQAGGASTEHTTEAAGNSKRHA